MLKRTWYYTRVTVAMTLVAPLLLCMVLVEVGIWLDRGIGWTHFDGPQWGWAKRLQKLVQRIVPEWS